MELEAIKQLLDYGVLGIAVVLLIGVVVRKDRKVNVLYSKLVNKSEQYTEKYHELASAQNEVLKELAEEIHEFNPER